MTTTNEPEELRCLLKEAYRAAEGLRSSLQLVTAEAAEKGRELQELRAALAEIHELIGRSPGHDTVAATRMCIVNAITTLQADLAEAARDLEACNHDLREAEAARDEARNGAQDDVDIQVGPPSQALTLEEIREHYPQVVADVVANPMALPWRVGRKVPRNLYDVQDRDIGRMDTAEHAAFVVEAVNHTVPLDANARGRRLGNVAVAIRDTYFEQSSPGSSTGSSDAGVVIDWVAIAQAALDAAECAERSEKS